MPHTVSQMKANEKILNSIGRQITTHNYKKFIQYYEQWKKIAITDNPDLVKNTLLTWALVKFSKENKQMALYLLEDGACAQIALNNVANQNDIDFIKTLLDKGANAQAALVFLRERRAVNFFMKTGSGEAFLRLKVAGFSDEQIADKSEEIAGAAEPNKKEHSCCIM